MAQMLRRLLDRIRGQLFVKNKCEEVFLEYKDTGMPLENLEVAVLRVFNSMNKDLLGPHKEPPSASDIQNEKTAIQNEKTKTAIQNEKTVLTLNEFSDLILKWAKVDLYVHTAHKIILALLAAPSLALVTKSAGKRAHRIGPVVEKIPTPVFFSVYSVGLVLAQR